jgi:ketosteroid isomerase-like protein
MSQENVEIVRRLIEAWNRRDLEGALQDLHPDAEVDWSESFGVQRGMYRGVGAIRRFWQEWLEIFDEIDIRPEAFITVGEHVVVPNRGYFRGRDSVGVDARSASVFKLRDGRSFRNGSIRTRKRPSKPWGCGSRRCRRRGHDDLSVVTRDG